MKFLSKYLILVVLSMFLLSGCDKIKAVLDKNQTKTTQTKKMPPQAVSVYVAKAEDMPLSFSYPARLVTDMDVIIKPKVSGAIMKKYFKAGDRVKKGDKLFLIEPDKYKASVDMAIAEVALAKSTLSNAKKEYERNKVLIKKKAISQKDYDTTLAAFNNAEATLKNAEAKLQDAKLDLSYTEVSAPFDGILGDSLVDVGDYVNATSSDLVRITNLDPIYAEFYISDTDKLNINRNLKTGKWELQNIDTQIVVSGKTIVGKLDFIDSVIDANSGSVKAKGKFKNREGDLLPGTFTTITTEGFVQKNGFKIPQVAILQSQNEVYVYVLVDGKVEKSPIKIIYQNNEYAIVSEGVKNGDKIIMDNFKKIRIGSEVVEVGSK